MDQKFEDKAYDGLAEEIEAAALVAQEGLGGASVYLVGMMGSGKSTVGRMLARALEYTFFDSDTLVEQGTQSSVAQLFEEEGEEGFREAETQVMQELAPFSRLVVATGGGVVTRTQNWGHMQHGVVVWLRGAPELLASRVVADGAQSRPLVAGSQGEGDEVERITAKLQGILEDRKDMYSQADVHVGLGAAHQPLGAPPAIVTQRVLNAIIKKINESTAEREAKRTFEIVDSSKPQEN